MSGGRRRLDHIDAMRPIKQAGVLTNHTILAFTVASPAVSGVLLLLHVSREGFFFVSACMLTYAYRDLSLRSLVDLRRFYRRRFVSVGLPYLCWTGLYFVLLLPTFEYPPARVLVSMVTSGWYQLYYLLVILQFYLLFPLLLALLRRLRGRGHVTVLAVALAAQLALVTLMHWNLLLPGGMRDFWARREVTSYEFYLVAGAVVAFHLDAVHGWLVRHARLVIGLTVAAAALAETAYWLWATGISAAFGSGNDEFQPSVVPFNIGAIACLYLVGVALVDPRRSARLRAAVRIGSDNSYGVYLAHAGLLTILGWLGWAGLGDLLPWPVLVLGTAVLVYLACVALTAVLARTPASVALTGRQRFSPRTDAHAERLDPPSEHRQQLSGVGS
jgi:peptidoglycan/LPS O-acetylase OafA/YrhL